MTEIWRNIEFENYQVSNTGKYRSVDHYANVCGGSQRFVKGRILIQTKNNSGYCCGTFLVNGKCITKTIHRLVAIAFIPIPDELKGIPIDKLDVDHIDGNKDNNCIENLHWLKHKDNCRQKPRLEKLSKPVKQYTLDMIFIKEYPSVSEASRQTGIRTSDICRCCKGIYKQMGGYIWEYTDI